MRASEFNNRRVALKDEVEAALIEALPVSGSIEIEFEDSAGNEIESISRKGVIGDSGQTSYPLWELSLCDMISLLSMLETINEVE